MAEKENVTISSKLNDFMTKNRKAIIVGICVVLVALVAFICVTLVNSKATAKNLNAIDIISFELTDGSGSLEEAEFTARKAKALEDLTPYTKKGGVAGVRANMLCAEIAFQNKDYASAINYWEATAKKGPNSYTAPLANYNKAVCYEELNDLDKAAEGYKAAADSNFVLSTHAKFNYARILETKGDYAGAIAAYKELNDSNPDEKWGSLAKTRIIALEAAGKAN